MIANDPNKRGAAVPVGAVLPEADSEEVAAEAGKGHQPRRKRIYPFPIHFTSHIP